MTSFDPDERSVTSGFWQAREQRSGYRADYCLAAIQPKAIFGPIESCERCKNAQRYFCTGILYGGELGRANCEHALRQGLLPFHREPRCCEKWLPVMGGEFILGSPCEMAGQVCPACGEGVMQMASDGVDCPTCGTFMPAGRA